MLPYLIPLVLIVLVARIGRFCAATGSNRPEYWEKTWRCDGITEVGGSICSRLRGHWGWHRTRAQGALRWYETWQGKGEEVFVIGFFGPPYKKTKYQGRGV